MPPSVDAPTGGRKKVAPVEYEAKIYLHRGLC